MTAWPVAAAGGAALAVAMGVGRFAFTPLLPIMLADGVTDLAAASWLASANYFGYLVGALVCTFQPWLWRQAGCLRPANGPALVRGGLVATVLLTLGMALPLPALWPALRFAAGVASAFVFVFSSGWCLAQLARLNMPAMGALMFTGPGAGIVLSGLAASGMVALDWPAAAGWLIFGVLGAALTAIVWPIFRPGDGADLTTQATAIGTGPATATTTATETTAAAAAAATADAAADTGAVEIGLLALAYGLAGFGYIITATFLPVIARQALPASPWLDMFWPIFGLGVIAGALLASRLRLTFDMRWLLAGCYLVQALGIVVSLAYPSLIGFALGSLLLGLPFTAITFFALHEVRRLRPAQTSSTMGLLTALYGLGQIAGPPLAAALLTRGGVPGGGFALSLQIAAMALVVGAAIYAAMTRMFPKEPPGQAHAVGPAHPAPRQ